MKNIFSLVCFILVAFLNTHFLYANTTEFQVRLILNDEELTNTPYETLDYEKRSGDIQKINVAKDKVLTDYDVQNVFAALQTDLSDDQPSKALELDSDGYVDVDSLDEELNLIADPKIEFALTTDGAKKWADFTSKNLKRNAAVIVDSKVIAKTRIGEQVTDGTFEIFSETDNIHEIKDNIKDMGLKLKVKPPTS